ncbi:hypothetical protein EG829_25870 [bacterium]|nr:hypothetical protein [bacterium]
MKAGQIVRKVKEDTRDDEDVPNILSLSEFESSSCFGCGAGSSYISVNNNGQVVPCVAVPLSLGSIHDTDLKDIYSAMGACFGSPGATCLGRHLGKVMRREGYSSETHPYPCSDSWRLASLCAGRSNQADLFKHLNGKG